MDAARTLDDDGGANVSGDGGGGGAGASPPSQPLPQLHPPTVSVKQHKERHIVAWTQQEDDLLREQVGIHGTENWTCIAAQFKDKTGRQCRRRWYSYLKTECKKGGWSPEEDKILCEAQKIFGNRWTEIAKVVSGRTDNAVKNRFTTLCKKRAKHESMSKENSCSYPTSNNENIALQDGCVTSMPSESSSTLKRIKFQTENDNMSKRTRGEHMEHVRPPLAVLVQNFNNADGLLDHQHTATSSNVVQNEENVLNIKVHGSLIRTNDPKVSVLMQQAQLLSSIAQKIYTDSTEQSLENMWKELQDYLIQSEETMQESSDVSHAGLQLDDFKDLIEDLRSSSMGSHPSLRQSNIHEDSHHGSEQNNGSIHDLNVPIDKKVLDAEESSTQKTKSLLEQGAHIGGNASQEVEMSSGSLDCISAAIISPCEVLKETGGTFSVLPDADFNSPLQTMPLFRPSAEGIPSPKFSASERQFLLSVLGLSSSSPNQSNPSQQPSCRKALLHSL